MRAPLLAVLLIAGCSGGNTTSDVCGSQSGLESVSQHVTYAKGYEGLERSIGGIYTASWPTASIPMIPPNGTWVKAAQQWEEAAGVKFDYTQRGIVHGGDTDEPKWCGVAYTYSRGDTIYLCEIFLNPENITAGRCPSAQSVIAHEIGHCIGVQGHTADGGLMDTVGGNGKITRGVAEKIRELYGTEC